VRQVIWAKSDERFAFLLKLQEKKQRAEDENAIEQFNGREGETATSLSRCPLNSELRGGGFAPRHLSRSALVLEVT
jgi:hypothetical protein